MILDSFLVIISTMAVELGLTDKRGIGEYDDLNETDPIQLESGLETINLEAFADRIVAANYGTHRLLSALIRARMRSPKFIHDQPDLLLEGLKKLLNSGLH